MIGVVHHTLCRDAPGDPHEGGHAYRLRLDRVLSDLGFCVDR
jgi:hypothetical protein